MIPILFYELDNFLNLLVLMHASIDMYHAYW